ncbi:MAG: Mov34/MPN/PAD-1 family protein [Scytonematopsis contorta HA4267-MV1]|jgi:proteasome lid subunit RPN8/RPN11|nr:Mov34/MPN/PAD-1 family protein [Scytonematopsis contorta HA4267-MV1]
MQQINLSGNEIIWEESDDVYKPIVKSIYEFRIERSVKYQNSQVYIKNDALNNLTKHLESNLRVEQGGILFGNAYQDPDSKIIYVEITAAIAAPATIGTGSHLEFTSDSWFGIMEYARKEHPQENIVGWYHSHPNIGVFMSGTDMRTQQAFFYHPWCLSIVCDPVREEIGFFLGEKAISLQPVFFIEKCDVEIYNKHNLKYNIEKLPIKIDNKSNYLLIAISLVFIITGLTILIAILFSLFISQF